MNFFDHVKGAPADPIFGIQTAFQKDPREGKVNLSVGLYRDEELKTPVLESVRQAEREVLAKERSKEYLPIEGHGPFIAGLGKLVFGKGYEEKIFGAQTVGGTGALRIGGDFLMQEAHAPLFMTDPTWPNHRGVFSRCGFQIGIYPYYDFKHHRLEFDRMSACFEMLKEGTIILFHAGCHNPTGCDPSEEQWKGLREVVLRKKLLPFFDFAYQGLGKGIEEDAYPVRLFAEGGVEMLVAVSGSKNFSLYAERIGALFIVAKNRAAAQHCGTKLRQIIRTNYSNPPLHGAEIVAHILHSEKLQGQWRGEVDGMRKRIIAMRKALVEKIPDSGYLLDRYGMFCYLGLSEAQTHQLQRDAAIYITSDGRVNVAGLNRKNVDHVAREIVKVMRKG